MACQSCEGCNNCNRCEGCHGCNSCDTCQTCNASCNGPVNGCLQCEGFCQIDQTVSSWQGEFSWGVSVTSNSLFFSKSTWNKIIKYINKARAAGDTTKGVTSGLKALKEDDNTFMTASKFNEVSSALFNLGGNDSIHSKKIVYAVGSDERPEGDIIYGSYFTNLADQANHLKYKSNQCDLCNTGCNNCNECQNCNKCLTNNERDGKCKSGNTSSNCCEATTTT